MERKIEHSGCIAFYWVPSPGDADARKAEYFGLNVVKSNGCTRSSASHEMKSMLRRVKFFRIGSHGYSCYNGTRGLESLRRPEMR